METKIKQVTMSFQHGALCDHMTEAPPRRIMGSCSSLFILFIDLCFLFYIVLCNHGNTQIVTEDSSSVTSHINHSPWKPSRLEWAWSRSVSPVVHHVTHGLWEKEAWPTTQVCSVLTSCPGTCDIIRLSSVCVCHSTSSEQQPCWIHHIQMLISCSNIRTKMEAIAPPSR